MKLDHIYLFVIKLIVILTNNVIDTKGQELCGLNGCSALDLAKKFTEQTMAKMVKMIKPEALEKVFQNMDKMEHLIRMVEDLNRDVNSLFQPGNSPKLNMFIKKVTICYFQPSVSIYIIHI